jgi:hypothetical protein
MNASACAEPMLNVTVSELIACWLCAYQKCVSVNATGPDS